MIKEINTWAVFIMKYSGLFIKKTTEEAGFPNKVDKSV